MDFYEEHFRRLGYTVKREGAKLIVGKGDKRVIVSDQMMQTTNIDYIALMVREGTK